MNTSGTEHLAGNSNADGLNINPESFYYSLKFVNSAIESANEFNNSINSKSIDSSLVAKLGYSFDAIKTCAKETLNTLNELSTRMGNTKDILSRISSTNSSIFESIDAQINLNNLLQFGDLESETDQQLYWNYMADIYRGAQAKLSQNGVLSRASSLMNLNEIELFAINQMKEKSNLDLYEKYLKYRDMESQVTDLETEIRKLETERVAAINEGMQGAERRKALEAEIEELQKQRYDIKRKLRDVAPELKKSGYLEYTGWEQVCNSFKQMGDNWGEVFSNLYEGDFSEAWENTKVAFKSTGATFCVINEKLLAGGAKVLEYLNDGTVMLKTAITSPFLIAGDAIFGTDTLDQAWDNTMAYVAEDMVGDVEKVFYENTKVGQIINDNSLLKYDSAGANLFKNAGVKLTETAVCVVIGAFTAGVGGYAAAAGFGFLEGLGEGGERQFNIVDEDGNYTNRNLKGVALATLNGGAKAVQSVGYAKMGRGLASAFGNQPVGANEMSKFATKLDTALAKSPKVARVAVKTLVNGDTAIELAGAGCRYAATGIETGDWKAGIGEFALDAGLTLVGNYATQWKLDSKLRLADVNKPSGTSIDANGEIVKTGGAAPVVAIPENPGDIVVINPIDEIDDEIAKAMDLGDYDTVRKLQSQKSALFQEEMTSVFGAENVEHVSGIDADGIVKDLGDGKFIYANGSVVDTKALDRYVHGYADIGDYARAWEIHENEFIENGIRHGYSEDTIKRYMSMVENSASGNSNWSINEENIMAGKFEKYGIKPDQFTALSQSEKNEIIDELRKKDAVWFATLDEEFKSSREVMGRIDIGVKNGAFARNGKLLTQDDVLETICDAKSGKKPVGTRKVFINGVDKTALFPRADDIQSDKQLYEYTMELLSKSGYDTSGISSMEELADYIEKTQPTIKGTTFQDATPGAKNLERFGSVGPVRGVDFEGGTGGAYVAITSPKELAEKFPDCCHMDGGKLVIDSYEKFGQEVLSGVPLNSNGVYQISVEIPLNSSYISMPSINNGSYYISYAVPDGHLLSGGTETVMRGIDISKHLNKIGTDSRGNPIYRFIKDFSSGAEDPIRYIIERK